MTKPANAPKNGDEKAAKAAEPAKAEVPPAPLQKRSAQALVLAVLACLTLTALDIWTKTWAEQELSYARQGPLPEVCGGEDGNSEHQRLNGDDVVLIEGLLVLDYTENCGAAFGLLRAAPDAVRKPVFGLAATVAVIALFVLFYQGRGGRLFAWSVPLVASGALGNLHDRLRYGYVIDFIHAFYRPWDFDWPTFNVADITITIGVALLILDSFRGEPAPETVPAADAGGASVTKAKREAVPATDAEVEGEGETSVAASSASDESAAREPAEEPEEPSAGKA